MNGSTQNSYILLFLFSGLLLISCNIPQGENRAFSDQQSRIWDISVTSEAAGFTENRLSNSFITSSTPTPQLIVPIDFEAAFQQSQTIQSNHSDHSSIGKDSAQWLYFSPVEYSTETIETLYAAFQNNGETIWTDDYYLEFYAGKNPSKEDKIRLNHTAVPGNNASYEIPINSTDPSWKSCWQMKNSSGTSFYEFCYNHGSGTIISGAQSAQNTSSENDTGNIFYPFTKTNGTAPAKFSSDELSAEFINTSPGDGHTFKAYDHSETLSVSFRNNGSEIWDSSYSLVFYSGYNWMHSTSFALQSPVSPGETAVFSLPIEIIEDNDRWVTCWYLSTPNGQNLSDFCFRYYTKS